MASDQIYLEVADVFLNAMNLIATWIINHSIDSPECESQKVN